MHTIKYYWKTKNRAHIVLLCSLSVKSVGDQRLAWDLKMLVRLMGHLIEVDVLETGLKKDSLG
jgi:hypothetical protein